MSYLEIIKKALNGRSVNAAAKQWGIQQVTLNRYANGSRLPDYLTAKTIAKEAGISSGEMFDLLADEEARRRDKPAKIAQGFKFLLRIANVGWTRVPATA